MNQLPSPEELVVRGERAAAASKAVAAFNNAQEESGKAAAVKQTAARAAGEAAKKAADASELAVEASNTATVMAEVATVAAQAATLAAQNAAALYALAKAAVAMIDAPIASTLALPTAPSLWAASPTSAIDDHAGAPAPAEPHAASRLASQSDLHGRIPVKAPVLTPAPAPSSFARAPGMGSRSS